MEILSPFCLAFFSQLGHPEGKGREKRKKKKKSHYVGKSFAFIAFLSLHYDLWKW